MPLEKPDLSDEQITWSVQSSYGLHLTQIEFLPLGYDFNAGVYRVRADSGQDYFLKARRNAAYEPGIHGAHYLRTQGMRQVVAPLPTVTGELWGQTGTYTLLLYPYIEGRAGADAGLSDAQWVEYGEILRQLHTVQLPAALADTLRRENFIPTEKAMNSLRQLHAAVGQQTYTDPLQQQLAAFWREHAVEIGHIIERVDALSQRLQTHRQEFVLCHADIHTYNLLLTEHGELFVVDWDQPMLAPKERDLLFVLDRGIGFGPDKRQEALFFEGYGHIEIDTLALAYYRYEWLVQDLGEFASVVFRVDSAGEETRQDSARLFKAQFDPGSLVEIARRLDAVVFNAEE